MIALIFTADSYEKSRQSTYSLHNFSENDDRNNSHIIAGLYYLSSPVVIISNPL